MPLQPFCVVSGGAFLLLSLFSYMLLNFKRDIALTDHVQPTTNHLLLIPRPSSAVGLLILLRLFCLFGVVWSFIGYNWVISSGPTCHMRILQVWCWSRRYPIISWFSVFVGCRVLLPRIICKLYIWDFFLCLLQVRSLLSGSTRPKTIWSQWQCCW